MGDEAHSISHVDRMKRCIIFGVKCQMQVGDYLQIIELLFPIDLVSLCDDQIRPRFKKGEPQLERTATALTLRLLLKLISTIHCLRPICLFVL